MDPVGPPVTRTEAYLAAVLEELRGIRADLAAGSSQAAQPDPAPAKAPTKRTRTRTRSS